MKRKTLTTAVMAGLTGMAGMVGVSNAVNLNPDGLGQVLLYPYYTVRGGNDTLISVVNTTDNAKSIKIRFMEALNSREVFDFNIYMSAFDVWTAAITATAAGGGKLLISDRTCTVPYFVEDPIYNFGEPEFVEYQYAAPGRADGGPTDITRTAAGYIEIIEMGTLVNATKNSAAAATHSDGEPANCNQLLAAWAAGGYWTANSQVDHEPPSGGLYGGASILNVEEGTLFSYNAVAIDAFSDNVLHTDPGSLLPSLASGGTNSIVFINGQIDNQLWDDSVDAFNATIMYNQIMNEYVIEGSANARSEWVVTFPTKRFHTDGAPGGPGVGAPIEPFTDLWTVASPSSCETINFRFWDREEREPGPGAVIPSPIPPGPVGFELCREANVIRFSQIGEALPDVAEITKESRAEGTPYGYRNFALPSGFRTGWVRFEFNPDPMAPIHESRPSQSGQTYLGLPVVGFWVNTFTNNVLVDDAGDNVRANYGGAFQHRGTRATSLAPTP